MIVLLSIIVIIWGLTIAMVLTARKNAKEGRRKAIKYYRDNQRSSRLRKWRRLAIKWKEELKKPVKVNFT